MSYKFLDVLVGAWATALSILVYEETLCPASWKMTLNAILTGFKKLTVLVWSVFSVNSWDFLLAVCSIYPFGFLFAFIFCSSVMRVLLLRWHNFAFSLAFSFFSLSACVSGLRKMLPVAALLFLAVVDVELSGTFSFFARALGDTHTHTVSVTSSIKKKL